MATKIAAASARRLLKLFSNTETDKTINDEPTELPDLQEEFVNDKITNVAQ